MYFNTRQLLIQVLVPIWLFNESTNSLIASFCYQGIEEEEVLESILERDFQPVMSPVAAETLKKEEETIRENLPEEPANMTPENPLPEKEAEA